MVEGSRIDEALDAIGMAVSEGAVALHGGELAVGIEANGSFATLGAKVCRSEKQKKEFPDEFVLYFENGKRKYAIPVRGPLAEALGLTEDFRVATIVSKLEEAEDTYRREEKKRWRALLKRLETS